VPVSRHTRDQEVTDTEHGDVGTGADLPDWGEDDTGGRRVNSVTDRRGAGGDWMESFLDLLAGGHSVIGASTKVGIRPRTAYSRRKTDQYFRIAWDRAVSVGTRLLEQEAARRAYYGTLRGVYYRGVKCGVERTYSDTLMIFLLKARRPEVYRERYDDGARSPVQINVNVETVTDTRHPVQLVTDSPAPTRDTDPVPPVQVTDQCTLPINPPGGEEHRDPSVPHATGAVGPRAGATDHPPPITVYPSVHTPPSHGVDGEGG
jgi:hypothetical protein